MALEWYNISAYHNNSHAQNAFTINVTTTMHTFFCEKAAKQNLPKAQSMIDYLYGWTRSGPTHYDTAKYWFKKSADQSLSVQN